MGIDAGEVYVYATSLYNGSWSNYRFHLACNKLQCKHATDPYDGWLCIGELNEWLPQLYVVRVVTRFNRWFQTRLKTKQKANRKSIIKKPTS